MPTGGNMKKLIILGAAGRDFHDFNVYWKKQEDVQVVCFTATQIPYIDDRTYPPELCGPKYPDGIKIYSEDRLEELIKKYNATHCALAYSDLPHTTVMHMACRVQAAGCDFVLLGHHHSMIVPTKPVVAICATRTGVGKSQTTRVISSMLKSMGKRIAVCRHPMPYGSLSAQRCQRFETLEDLVKHKCTIEEIEEYEPHIAAGNLLFAGVDYEMILRAAEAEADVVLWDGGNNDNPFFRPTLYIVLADPHRPADGLLYYPGETNLRMADVIILNKCDTAESAKVEEVVRQCAEINKTAPVIKARSPCIAEHPDMIKDKRVLVIEDGPTVTHGGMAYGAGWVAAKACGAAELVDPRPWCVGSIKATMDKFQHLKEVLPAMGYGALQIKELQETVNKVPCDVVLVGTPIDLRRQIHIDKPNVRVTYDLALDPADEATLKEMVRKAFAGRPHTEASPPAKKSKTGHHESHPAVLY